MSLQGFAQIMQALAQCSRVEKRFFLEVSDHLVGFNDICDVLAQSPLQRLVVNPTYFVSVREAFRVAAEACAKYAQETELINFAENLSKRCEVMRQNYQGCRAKVDQEFMTHYMLADQLQPECANLKQLMAALRMVIEDDSTAFFSPSIVVPYMSDIHHRRDNILGLEEQLVRVIGQLNMRVDISD